MAPTITRWAGAANGPVRYPRWLCPYFSWGETLARGGACVTGVRSWGPGPGPVVELGVYQYQHLAPGVRWLGASGRRHVVGPEEVGYSHIR